MKTTTSPNIAILSSKAPVVATHTGSFNTSSIKLTLERYQTEGLTYVRPSEIAQYQKRFLDMIILKKTAIGCIVSPFGYGKTSAAINTWKVCEERNILAVPPFSCGSISEMGHAIATGIAHQLGIDSPQAEEVIQAYEAYLTSSASRLAEQDAKQFQIDFDTALRSIEDKIERGYLNIEATGNHLLAFLEQLTHVVEDAGYSGLLVIVDEFQQFLGNINKSVITNFRTLVWGLRTRGRVPFGLLITMDPDTERNLSERAGDILHRIKEDGLYLDFSDSYDRDFARLLWSQYAETFHFSDESARIIDNATLDALGQICERHDLSNGPRTVIDVFQRIANVFRERNRAYSPIDLIDDFLAGSIRFDGDRSKIASLVTELTGYEYIKASPDRLNTLKLISAFPRGCPRSVAEKYNLAEAYDQLTDSLRGEVLTELSEGMALIDLQRIGKPQNKLNILLKKYWMQITEDEIISDHAVTLFSRYAVEPFFPPFRNILSGWSSIFSTFQLTSSGSYQQIYKGTFFDEYPQRRICIQVCRYPGQIALPEESVDIHIIFILRRLTEPPIKSSFDIETHTFKLGLVLDEPFTMALPRDIRWIEDFLRPVVLTPGVLLSLIEYIHTQTSTIEGITENEIQRIAAYQQKLNSYLLTMVYCENLFTGIDVTVESRGEQALRSVLYQVLQHIYPEYQTLITTPQWESLLRIYLGVIESVSLLHSRGLEPLAENKANLAIKFGLRNHAGFESFARQFGPLLTLESWSGDEGSVRFYRHPGEDWLLNSIVLQGEVSEKNIIEKALEKGYLPEETHYLLQLLQKRGYIQHNPEIDLFTPAQVISHAELLSEAEELRVEIYKVQAITDIPTLHDAENQLIQAVALMHNEKFDQQELAEARVRLLQAQQIIHQARVTLVQFLRSELLVLRSNLYEVQTRLQQPLALSKTGLALDAHINGAYRNLEAKSESITTQLSKVIIIVKKVLSHTSDMFTILLPTIETVDDLCQEFSRLKVDCDSLLLNAQEVLALRDLHAGWIQMVDQIQRIGNYISILKSTTDVDNFLRRQDTLIDNLMEGLSVSGITHYSELYNKYHPFVETLYLEVSTAIRAVELAHSHPSGEISPKNQNQSHDLFKARKEIMKLTHRKSTTLKAIIKACSLQPDELQQMLVELEAEGRLSIQIRSGKENKP